MIIIIISAAHIRFSLSYIITSSVCVVLKGRSDSLCGHYTGLAVRAADAVVDGGSVAQGMLPCTKSRVRFPKCDYLELKETRRKTCVGSAT